MKALPELRTALRGGQPTRTPLSIYNWMIDDYDSPQWKPLFEQGLLIIEHCETVRISFPGAEYNVKRYTENGKTVTCNTWKTPIGAINEKFIDSWRQEYFIKQPGDYAIVQWLYTHSEITPVYTNYYRAQDKVKEKGLVVPGMWYFRTPLMKICVDYAGTERFCTDIALEVEELFSLYEQMCVCHEEEMNLIARGPGEVIKLFENLTISTLGPKRYRDFLLPVYEADCTILEEAGKRLSVHYDGGLKAISAEIKTAPFTIIESLTEPPEGDMYYDECRRTWPDKTFWANINVDAYALPPMKLREEVKGKIRRAGRKGLAFEISEDLPSNWEHSIPVVLDALE